MQSPLDFMDYKITIQNVTLAVVQTEYYADLLSSWDNETILMKL
jgi:hypothetical protein